MSTEDTMSPTERDPALTFTDAEQAERKAKPFSKAELDRLRVEPFAPLWSSLSGLVARFLATLDAEIAANPRLTPAPSPDALRDAVIENAREWAADDDPACECGLCLSLRALDARAALATPAEPPAAPPTLDTYDVSLGPFIGTAQVPRQPRPRTRP